MFKHASSALLALTTLVRSAQAQSLPGTETFLSRPGQVSIKLNVQTNKNPKALAPGYVFASPYDRTPDGNYGTHIWTMDGDLVFSGQYLQEKRAMDSHVCNFEGINTLCFTDALPDASEGAGHAPGQDRFFDNTYTQLSHDFGAAGNLTRPDVHELNTPSQLKGKGMIVDIFQETPQNLTLYDGPEKGYILAGCFQQRRFKGDKVQFQWCSNDHVELYETYGYLAGNSAGNNTNGDKGTKHNPWDYFHINAIDIDDNGDYYVSSRATHTIFKIAGLNRKNPGEIIWRLGGRYSDFKEEDPEKLYFYSQHDVRVEKMKGDKTLLSIYDNHFPQVYPKLPKAKSTTAKYIELDTKKMTAKLVQLYNQPESQFGPTGGQVQTLSNGNVFVGWGSLPSVSEHRHGNPGEVLWYGTFNDAYKSYRSYKYPWVGKPALPPDVFAYQHKCESKQAAIYMSWNGATEYLGFKVFGVDVKTNKGGKELGEHDLKTDMFKKTGYETVANINVKKEFFKFIYVKAMGRNGKVLGTSDPIKMFVPDRALSDQCDIMSCPMGTNYTAKNSRAHHC